ncbi:MAG: hypothetical protein H6581_22840 [Bacteroidia bacterium]|nr:hypothetical protein [Bacteroidia bacterium]
MHPLKIIFYILMTFSVAACLWNRKFLPKRVGIFIPLIFSAILTTLVTQFWIKSPAVNHMYQLVAYPLLAIYLRETLKKPLLKKLILASIPVFWLATGIYYLIFPNVWSEAHFPEMQLYSLFVVFATLAVFYQMYMDENLLEIRREPDFWIGAAHLIYYAGFLLTMGSYFYVLNVLGNKGMATPILKLTYYLNLTLYALYTVAFLCPRRKTSTS